MEMKDYTTAGLETIAECSVVGLGIGLIGKALGLPKWAIAGISFIPGAIIGYKNAKKAQEKAANREFMLYSFLE